MAILRSCIYVGGFLVLVKSCLANKAQSEFWNDDFDYSKHKILTILDLSKLERLKECAIQ